MANGQAGRLFLGGFNQVLQAQQLAETKRLNERKAAAAKRLADLQSTETLAEFLQIDDPSIRRFMVETHFRNQNVDLKDPTAAGLMKVIDKADAAARGLLADAVRQAGISGTNVEALIPALRKDPASILKLIQQQGALRKLGLAGGGQQQAPTAPGVARPGVAAAPAAPGVPGVPGVPGAAAQVSAAPAPTVVPGQALVAQPTAAQGLERKAQLAGAAGLPSAVSASFGRQADRAFQLGSEKFARDVALAGAKASAKERVKTEKELRTAQFDVRRIISRTSEAIDLARGSPDILSAVGAMARTVDTMVDQAQGFAKVVGIRISPELRDPGQYADVWDNIGTAAVQSAQVRSVLTDMAYVAAALSGQKGRDVSDRDVERFIKIIGAGTGSVDQLIGTLVSFTRRAERDFQLRGRTFGVRVPKSLIIDKPIEQMTAEDLIDLSDRIAPELLTENQKSRLRARARKLAGGN